MEVPVQTRRNLGSTLVMARKNRKKIDPRNVYLDEKKLHRARLNRGWAVRTMADEMEIAFNTARSAFAGEGVSPSVAKEFADFIGCTVTDLLAERDPRYVPSQLAQCSLAEAEWELAEYLGPGMVASNGLHYFVCRMQHRSIASRMGRGKFYHLSFLSTDDAQKKRTQVARHGEVSNRVGPHRHVAENESLLEFGDGSGAWVVDRWIGRTTLADRLADGPLDRDELLRLMCEIALGLEALHKADIVFRELAPSRVLLAEDDGRAVLTDFELAKLLDGAPTVSDAWPEDVYRAPEVDSGNVDVRADLYSWARVLVRAATGGLPECGADADALTRVDLPKGLLRVAVDCLSPDADERRQNIQKVVRAVKSRK